MTRNPLALETWLTHHHRHLGCCRFYIRVEGGAPDLEQLFASHQDRLDARLKLEWHNTKTALDETSSALARRVERQVAAAQSDIVSFSQMKFNVGSVKRR